MENMFKEKLENLKKEVLSTLYGMVKLIIQKTGEDEILFGEYNISSPIHTQNEDGNLAQTIASLKIENDKVIFVIDASYTDFKVDSEEVSTENLIALIGICEEIGS